MPKHIVGLWISIWFPIPHEKKNKGLIFSQHFPPGRNIEITHGPEKVLGIPVGKNLNMSETWNKKTEKKITFLFGEIGIYLTKVKFSW